MARTLKVTLVRSLIGLSPKQEATVRALGLRRPRQTVEHADTPTIRGMIRLVPFCLAVEGRGAAEGEPSGSGDEASRSEPGRGAAEGEPSASKNRAERSETKR